MKVWFSNRFFRFPEERPFTGRGEFLSPFPIPTIIVLIGGVLLIGIPKTLQGLTGDITKDPAKVVEKYVSLDKRGARLEADSFEVLRPYIAWTDEPAWGQLVVISGYSVSYDVREWKVINSLEAVIPVRFHVLGMMQWETATYLAEPRTEQVNFRIKAILNRWRIIAPLFPPHVGRKRLKDFVRHARFNETDEERMRQLKDLEDVLERAR